MGLGEFSVYWATSFSTFLNSPSNPPHSMGLKLLLSSLYLLWLFFVQVIWTEKYIKIVCEMYCKCFKYIGSITNIHIKQIHKHIYASSFWQVNSLECDRFQISKLGGRQAIWIRIIQSMSQKSLSDSYRGNWSQIAS